MLRSWRVNDFSLCNKLLFLFSMLFENQLSNIYIFIFFEFLLTKIFLHFFLFYSTNLNNLKEI